MVNVDDLVDYNWDKVTVEKKERNLITVFQFVKLTLGLVALAYLVPLIFIFRLRAISLIAYFSGVSVAGFILIVWGTLAGLGRGMSKGATAMAEGIGAGAIAQNKSKDGSLPKSREKLTPFDGVITIVAGLLSMVVPLIYLSTV